MTRAFAVTRTVDRPVERVWSELTDWERAPTWMNGVESAHADGEPVAGTTVRFRARGKDRTSRIVEASPKRSLTLRSVQGGVTADYTYTLDPTLDPDGNGGTRLSLTVDCTTRGVWTAFGPMLRRLLRRTDGGQLDALKARIEGEVAR